MWAIHIAAREYESRVPFGYRPRKEEWIYYKMTFYEIMEEVIETLEREWRRWRKAVREQKFDGDFIKWLAQTDYFTDKWRRDMWERKVRYFLEEIDMKLRYPLTEWD